MTRNQAANEVYGYSHGLTNVLADWRRTSDKDYMRGYRRGEEKRLARMCDRCRREGRTWCPDPDA